MADTAIFGVDGTLVDTDYHHALARSRAFPRQALDGATLARVSG